MTTNEKIELLRGEMKKLGLAAYVVPTTDPHLSEYTPDHYKFRHWLSGFLGSAGTVVVTMEKSGLWTDGRYYIQAAREIENSEIKLFRAAEPGVKTYTQYLCDELKKGDVVGISGQFFSQSGADRLKKDLAAKGIELNNEHDLSEKIWLDRPPLPYSPAFVLDVQYAGETARSKLGRVRDEMKKRGVTHYVVGKLDAVMWLSNLRGADIHCCPFAISYALVGPEKAWLYIDERSLDGEVSDKLMGEGFEIRPYESIYGDIAALGEDCTLGADFNAVNSGLTAAAKQCSLKNIRDIVNPFKAVKNETENKNLMECYENDVVALTKGFYWIYKCLDEGKKITEYDVFEKLIELRAEQPLNLGPSFDTIAAYKGNAAMMHYKPEPDNSAVLEREGMLLIDSGGQYLNGTTDITRTLVLGPISDEERHAFTLVLKSSIAMMTAKFLRGTTGANLDILARGPLWDEGIDYKCGTGHGVGFCLNVHEGPQNLSQSLNSAAFEIGMNCTVEPGVYIENRYGIRTENDVIVAPFTKTEHGEFYRFELLSYCPIDVSGIDPLLLSGKERAWINAYHEVCRNKLRGRLTDEEYAWLENYTREI
ncbi:MAG: aminopeptidase P family protein [Oscillospiraceae bacterium]|nr:aminopeptidase P family protein [Oscillospiraceae bacterium]